uniref:BED-type domain-containing protein n=1 Tax=Hordeum vulgare subsp. vulgare TaxID=112509 RepID=A0A8I6X739_HORVV
MEAAIAWLAQTILATLVMDKMVEWVAHVGLADAVERLQSEVERVEMVVAAVKGREAGNRPLSRSLNRLKELLYDADDIVDELDYYRLQQQVEGVDDPEDVNAPEQVHPSRGNSDIPTSSRRGRKRRSKAWETFDVIEEDDSEKPAKARCKHCLTEIKCTTLNGTSGMHSHNRVCKKKPAGPNGHAPNPSR